MLGARCQLAKSTDKRAEYTIHGLPGKQQQISLFGAASARATLDGRPIELAPRGDHVEFVLPAEEANEPSADGGQLSLQPSEKGFKVAGKCAVHVPAKASATVHVLCNLLDTKQQWPLMCSATINGKPAKVEIVQQPGNQEERQERFWTWLKFKVPDGQSQIELTVDNYQAEGKPLRGEVGWWLWTECPTTPHRLVLDLPQSAAPAIADPLPLPIEMEHYRQVLPIRGLEQFGGAAWTIGRRPRIYEAGVRNPLGR